MRAYAQRWVNASEAILQPVPASLEQVLQFEFGDPLLIDYRDGRSEASARTAIVGAHSFHRASLRFLGTVESFAVFLQPFGLWQLFGLPNSELRDQAFSGTDVMGAALHRVWLQMAETSSYEKRVNIIEHFLVKKLNSAARLTPIMAAGTYIFQHRGSAGIAAVAAGAGLGIRQFERRFAADVGITPMLFARISRFQKALDARLRMPSRSWMEIAHGCGYHDQMHMIHDFHDLAGDSPNRLMAHLGDGRPSALASEV